MPGLHRTGDILFTRAREVVLIDGCFFRGCPAHYVQPRTRTEFWERKISENRARDAETTQRFTDEGWTVLRFWEHEPVNHVVGEIERTVQIRASSRGG